MKLKKLLEEMERNMNRYDLSDDYLIAHNCETGRIGEFQYGVSSVPCEWVFPYLYALANDERLKGIVDEIEEEVNE